MRIGYGIEITDDEYFLGDINYALNDIYELGGTSSYSLLNIEDPRISFGDESSTHLIITGHFEDEVDRFEDADQPVAITIWPATRRAIAQVIFKGLEEQANLRRRRCLVFF
jgi:hypothetical protein